VDRKKLNEPDLPTDMLASLLMEQASGRASTTRDAHQLPAVYAVMVVTTLLTFGSLTAGYQLVFPHQLFA
jgi:hypothetical protein